MIHWSLVRFYPELTQASANKPNFYPDLGTGIFQKILGFLSGQSSGIYKILPKFYPVTDQPYGWGFRGP